jgi:phosphorylated CTD-interacting factor 1
MNVSDQLREDTPAIAVARKREVALLRSMLCYHTKRCRLIQREPGNALARFLFSSALPGVTYVRVDPVLPSNVSYDMSLCSELMKEQVSLHDAQQICEALCMASKQAVCRLEEVRRSDVDEAEVLVHAVLPSSERHQVAWRTESLVITSEHLCELRRLYATHATDDVSGWRFNRRLFCLLHRYNVIGGPTYHCSVTRRSFDELRSAFGVTKECFASPLNRNADIYWSAFADTDRFFGSNGSFYKALDSALVQEGGGFFANPPFVEEHMQALQEQVALMLELPAAVTFAVILPTWTDNASHEWMRTSPYTKMHFLLQPEQHEYVDGLQQTNGRKTIVARFTSSLFILQNRLGSARFPADDAKKLRLAAAFALPSRIYCDE